MITTKCISLSSSPLVLYLKNWHLLENLPSIFPQQKALIYLSPAWDYSEERLLEFNQVFESLAPIEIVWCCTRELAKKCENLGLKYVWCHPNCLINESNFYPLNLGKERKYNAILNASVDSYKRHYLAKQTERVAWLSRNGDLNQTEKIVRESGLFLLNPIGVKNKVIPYLPKDVNIRLNLAKVGLALSKEEGQNQASGEYALAGLPIVSTHSTGGRDELFDPRFTSIVDDDPEIIASEVYRLAESKFNPIEIRQSFLDLAYQHRLRLQSDIFTRTGADVPIDTRKERIIKWSEVWKAIAQCDRNTL